MERHDFKPRGTDKSKESQKATSQDQTTNGKKVNVQEGPEGSNTTLKSGKFERSTQRPLHPTRKVATNSQNAESLSNIKAKQQKFHARFTSGTKPDKSTLNLSDVTDPAKSRGLSGKIPRGSTAGRKPTNKAVTEKSHHLNQVGSTNLTIEFHYFGLISDTRFQLKWYRYGCIGT